MPSSAHRYGTCDVIASVRLKGSQPIQVRGVSAVNSRTGTEHLAVRVAGVLIYLEDRKAFDSLRQALTAAARMVETVFGPED